MFCYVTHDHSIGIFFEILGTVSYSQQMAESLAVSTQYTNVIDRQTSHDGMGCAYA